MKYWIEKILMIFIIFKNDLFYDIYLWYLFMIFNLIYLYFFINKLIYLLF